MENLKENKNCYSEEGLSFLKESPIIFPKMLRDFDRKDFLKFYNNLVSWLYGLIK